MSSPIVLECGYTVWPRLELVANRDLSTCTYRNVEARAEKQAAIAATKAYYPLHCTLGTNSAIRFPHA